MKPFFSGKIMSEKLSPKIILLFIFIVLSWGLAWPVNKIGLAYLTPLWYTAIRLLIGAFTMTALVAALGEFSWPTWKDLPLIAVIGLLQISFYILLTNVGLAYLPAGQASFLAYTTPLWIIPIATVFFGEKNTPVKWMGLILGLLGLMILLSPWEINWHNHGMVFGACMLLLASLSWAISMLAVRYMQWNKTPLQLIPWQLFLGALPVLGLALIKEPIISIQWNPALIASLIYTGFLVTGLSYWSGVVINKAIPTTVLSLGFLVVPVFSLLISSIYLHETLSLITASAMGMILIGLGMVAV